MSLFANLILAEAYKNIDTFLIVFVRVVGFILMLPIFSGANIPKTVKMSFSIILSLLICSTGTVEKIAYENNMISLGFIFLKEFVVGLMIAFVAYVFFSIVNFMGQMIDFELGLSMVSVYDPISQIQAPITGNLFYYVIILMFIQSGGLNAFISVIANSYKYIPAGHINLMFDGKIVFFVIYLIKTSFEAALRFSMPVIGAILLIDVGLGILVKAVPQMNVFVVGMPIKLLIGYVVLLLIAPITIDIYDYIFVESIKNMMELIQGVIFSG